MGELSVVQRATEIVFDRMRVVIMCIQANFVGRHELCLIHGCASSSCKTAVSCTSTVVVAVPGTIDEKHF